MEKEYKLKLSEDLYEESKELFEILGLNTDVAVNMFLSACLRDQAIPFPIALDPYEYFDGCDCDCNCGCECDEECDCGCNEGKECTCNHESKCSCHK